MAERAGEVPTNTAERSRFPLGETVMNDVVHPLMDFLVQQFLGAMTPKGAYYSTIVGVGALGIISGRNALVTGATTVLSLGVGSLLMKKCEQFEELT